MGILNIGTNKQGYGNPLSGGTGVYSSPGIIPKSFRDMVAKKVFKQVIDEDGELVEGGYYSKGEIKLGLTSKETEEDVILMSNLRIRLMQKEAEYQKKGLDIRFPGTQKYGINVVEVYDKLEDKKVSRRRLGERKASLIISPLVLMSPVDNKVYYRRVGNNSEDNLGGHTLKLQEVEKYISAEVYVEEFSGIVSESFNLEGFIDEVVNAEDYGEIFGKQATRLEEIRKDAEYAEKDLMERVANLDVLNEQYNEDVKNYNERVKSLRASKEKIAESEQLIGEVSKELEARAKKLEELERGISKEEQGAVGLGIGANMEEVEAKIKEVKEEQKAIIKGYISKVSVGIQKLIDGIDERYKEEELYVLHDKIHVEGVEGIKESVPSVKDLSIEGIKEHKGNGKVLVDIILGRTISDEIGEEIEVAKETAENIEEIGKGYIDESIRKIDRSLGLDRGLSKEEQEAQKVAQEEQYSYYENSDEGLTTIYKKYQKGLGDLVNRGEYHVTKEDYERFNGIKEAIEEQGYVEVKFVDEKMMCLGVILSNQREDKVVEYYPLFISPYVVHDSVYAEEIAYVGCPYTGVRYSDYEVSESRRQELIANGKGEEINNRFQSLVRIAKGLISQVYDNLNKKKKEEGLMEGLEQKEGVQTTGAKDKGNYQIRVQRGVEAYKNESVQKLLKDKKVQVGYTKESVEIREGLEYTDPAFYVKGQHGYIIITDRHMVVGYEEGEGEIKDDINYQDNGGLGEVIKKGIKELQKVLGLKKGMEVVSILSPIVQAYDLRTKIRK